MDVGGILIITIGENIIMNDITGQVSEEVINKLYNIPELTHPNVLHSELESAMKNYNDSIDENNVIKVGLFSRATTTFKPPKVHSVQDFIRTLRSGKLDSIVDNKDYLVDLYHKISDIRVMLEVKCVHRLSGKVSCGKNSLLALDRITKNPDDYVNL
jgi:hypothetical protein